MFGIDVLFYCGLAGAAFGLLYVFEIFSGEGEGRKGKGGRKRSDRETTTATTRTGTTTSRSAASTWQLPQAKEPP